MIVVEFQTLAEDHPAVTPGSRRMGPFEFVQLTYDLLRVSPDGETLAVLQEGVWQLLPTGERFSDVVLHAG